MHYNQLQRAAYADMLKARSLLRALSTTKKGGLTIQSGSVQDVWIWNGRPYWDDIFANMKKQRQHPDIGVCFCGTPVIGKVR
jgi:hypothetical protein